MISAELLRQGTLGWNLGNSLDAPGEETTWGNPPVTGRLIRAVADAGFTVVRIPVTWSPHMGPEPDFGIEETWMDRVEAVVGIVLDNGMLAVLNVHHDGADGFDGVAWLTLNDAEGRVTEENNRNVARRFVRLWEQLARRFREYDERLLFESMNEIHDGYGPPKQAYYGIINRLNQMFVDTVRQSGGNNRVRHLVLPGYNTNIEYTLEGLVLPKDPVPERLIVSVHYYEPWPFAGEGVTPTWGAAYDESDNHSQEGEVVARFDKLRERFGRTGTPVILGEYGAVRRSGGEAFRRYYMEFVTKAAKDRGILPIYWDNGRTGSGAESFGLFDRNTGAVRFPEILEAMMRAATRDYAIDDIERP